MKIEGGSRPPHHAGEVPPGSPLITVITVVFNGERNLEQAIRSVLGQTYGRVEYLVVDGGSTDGTIGLLRKYDDRIDHWVSEPDRGIYDAMNKGLERARGDLVGFLNCDDWYPPDALQAVAEAYRGSPSASVVLLGRWNAVYEDLGIRLALAPSAELHRLRLCHQAMFVSRGAYEKAGKYDPFFRYSADLEMAFRLQSLGIEFRMIPRVLVNFRASGASARKYRETGREQSTIVRRYLPLKTYLRFRILRVKFEALTAIASLFEALLGKRAGGALRRFYLGLTVGHEPIPPGPEDSEAPGTATPGRTGGTGQGTGMR